MLVANEAWCCCFRLLLHLAQHMKLSPFLGAQRTALSLTSLLHEHPHESGRGSGEPKEIFDRVFREVVEHAQGH